MCPSIRTDASAAGQASSSSLSTSATTYVPSARNRSSRSRRQARGDGGNEEFLTRLFRARERHSNTVHFIREGVDDHVLTFCGVLFHTSREVATDHNTHVCRLCSRIKDSHDTRGIQ